jgi:hypothetical protein
MTASPSDTGRRFSGKLSERLFCICLSRVAMMSPFSSCALCLWMTQLDIFMKTRYKNNK